MFCSKTLCQDMLHIEILKLPRVTYRSLKMILGESGVECGRGSEPELHGIGRGFLTNAYF